MITVYANLTDGYQVVIQKKKGCNNIYFLKTPQGEKQLLDIEKEYDRSVVFYNTQTQEYIEVLNQLL